MDEERMRAIAVAAAELTREVGGIQVLNEELRKVKFTLAAYLSQHEMHLITGEVYSECRECMVALYPR